jgi:hypothetical protein
MLAIESERSQAAGAIIPIRTRLTLFASPLSVTMIGT